MSSIEEDIKRCEQLTRPEHASWIGLSNQNAIKTLLCNLEALCDMQRSADRELQRQKQINEEHQKINGELREKVKELEEENKKKSIELICLQDELDNSIPKQVVKEVLQNNRNGLFGMTYLSKEQYKTCEMQIKRINKIEQELLGGGK